MAQLRCAISRGHVMREGGIPVEVHRGESRTVTGRNQLRGHCARLRAEHWRSHRKRPAGMTVCVFRLRWEAASLWTFLPLLALGTEPDAHLIRWRMGCFGPSGSCVLVTDGADRLGPSKQNARETGAVRTRSPYALLRGSPQEGNPFNGGPVPRLTLPRVLIL